MLNLGHEASAFLPRDSVKLSVEVIVNGIEGESRSVCEVSEENILNWKREWWFTIAKNQLQSTQMTIFVLLPSILLSGFVFPYEGMPKAAQYIAETLPATHFVRLIRGVVLRDVEIIDMAFDVYWLALFTLAGLAVATLRFKKSLD